MQEAQHALLEPAKGLVGAALETDAAFLDAVAPVATRLIQLAFEFPLQGGHPFEQVVDARGHG